jgi:hypothetical protein
MDQLKYQLELASFDEKIALAELEESKAAERVRELKYERTRFCMQWLELIARTAQDPRQGQVKIPGAQSIPHGTIVPPTAP